MFSRTDVLNLVRHSLAAKRILILPHAVRQMSRPDRMISVTEIRSVIKNGELVEDYPEDVRGHSFGCRCVNIIDRYMLFVRRKMIISGC